MLKVTFIYIVSQNVILLRLDVVTLELRDLLSFENMILIKSALCLRVQRME